MEILNIVVALRVRKFDLENFETSFEKKWKRQGFGNALTAKNEKPKYTLLAYGSGKMVLTGCKYKNQIKRAIKDIKQKLTNTQSGQLVRKYPTINMTAKYEFLNRIKYNDLKDNLNISYEPEIFTGLIYSKKNYKRKALIFYTGKAILTGIKSHKETIEFVNELKNELKIE